MEVGSIRREELRVAFLYIVIRLSKASLLFLLGISDSVSNMLMQIPIFVICVTYMSS
jgi:hypothetical protein